MSLMGRLLVKRNGLDSRLCKTRIVYTRTNAKVKRFLDFFLDVFFESGIICASVIETLVSNWGGRGGSCPSPRPGPIPGCCTRHELLSLGACALAGDFAR